MGHFDFIDFDLYGFNGSSKERVLILNSGLCTLFAFRLGYFVSELFCLC